MLTPWKETFFYGGSRAGRSALPLAPLHGPDTRQGALSARPSLWPWEQQSTRRGRVTPPQVLADLCAANGSRAALDKPTRDSVLEKLYDARDALPKAPPTLADRLLGL